MQTNKESKSRKIILRSTDCLEEEEEEAAVAEAVAEVAEAAPLHQVDPEQLK